MTCDALPAVGVFVAAATPQRLRRAFHSGAALPGLRAGRFCSDGWRGAHTARRGHGGDMAVVWEAC